MSRLFILAPFQVSPLCILRNLFQGRSMWQAAEPAAQRWKQTQRQPLHGLLLRQRLQSEGAAAPATCSDSAAHAAATVQEQCVVRTQWEKYLLCVCLISSSVWVHPTDFGSQHLPTKH